jgi:hypothetical protein
MCAIKEVNVKRLALTCSFYALFLLCTVDELVAQSNSRGWNKVANSDVAYLIKNDQVVEIMNLSAVCQNAREQIVTGIIKKTQKEKNNLTIRSVTLEDTAGVQEVINVEFPESRNTSRVDYGWLVSGLQSLLKEGRQATFGVRYCGGSSRLAYLNSIKETQFAMPRCYQMYEQEMEHAKTLIDKNGSMLNFARQLKALRLKYFEPTAEDLVYNQRLVDIWEAQERGFIDFDKAMSMTFKFMEEQKKNPGPPAKMKPC